jgi:demethylmenaquinone methyltransferase/2-methoxy-6-polyprenyl-1,4-benzoquinol methylase
MKAIFDSLAHNYDFANTIMSFGIHHYWRKFALAQTHLKPGEKALDLCCGTGMITADLAEQVGPAGSVIGMDLSGEMLMVAEKRLQKRDVAKRVKLIQGNASELPFPAESFDCVTIGYGLRNVLDPERVLTECHRVLKPGGAIVAIESAKPAFPLFRTAYYAYLKYWIPLVGRIICHNQSAYCYLGDSIIDFPSPQIIADLFCKAEFNEVNYTILTLGIIAVFTGKKINPSF